MTLPEHGSGSGSGGSGYRPPGPVFGAGGAPAYPSDPRVTPAAGMPTGVSSTAVSPQWEEPLDEEELVGPEPGRRLPWITGLLALAVIAAGAFWGGVMVQKHHDRNLVGTTTSAGGATGAAAGRTRGGGGFGGFGGAGGGATVGQVKLVDGSTIYVTDNSGNTITVKTTDSSTFTKQASVGLNAVAPGDTVIIRGAAQSDGSISAATVTDNGPGATAGTGSRAGAGGFGGAGSGTGTAGAGATGTGGGEAGGGGGG